MFAFDKNLDPEVFLGHCDLISWFSDFALSLDTVGMFSCFFHIMNEFDQTFNPNVLIGHYDLSSVILPYISALHYQNTPMQYTEIFLTIKSELSSEKIKYF